MDSTITQPPGRAGFSPGFSSGLWPGLWAPLVILVVGLASTAFTAHQESHHARTLAEAHYQAQHQALVHLLLARAPGPLEADSTSRDATQNWLQSVFSEALPPSMGVRVDTLARHTKRPLLQIRSDGPIDPTLALRTEVTSEHFRWMLTTVPARALMDQAATTASRNVWIAGAGLTLIATLMALTLSRRLHTRTMEVSHLESQGATAEQQITNLPVEKSILRQALNDSEQRSRDLVALSGAVIGELDEAAYIGFISPQIAELLERAPADLAGQPFEQLIAPPYRENFRRALTAARADQTIERIDLPLRHGGGDRTVNVALRIRALKDPVHGLSGFRLSALPHSGL